MLARPQPYPGNPAYLATVFLADRPPGGWPERFAVITACNPVGNRQASPEENQRANARLLGALRAAGHAPFAVTGASPDLAHQEPGWGFACETPDLPARVAADFDQDAFFWIEHGRIFLACDASGHGWPVADWAERLTGLKPPPAAGTT